MSNFGLFPNVIWFVILDHLPQKNWRTLKVNTHFRQLMVQKTESILKLWPEHYPEKKMEFIARAGFVETVYYASNVLKININIRCHVSLIKQNFRNIFSHHFMNHKIFKHYFIAKFKKNNFNIPYKYFDAYFPHYPEILCKWFTKHGYAEKLKLAIGPAQYKNYMEYIKIGYIRAGLFNPLLRNLGDFSLYCDILKIDELKKYSDKFNFTEKKKAGYRLGKSGDIEKIKWCFSLFKSAEYREGLVEGLCRGNHFEVFKKIIEGGYLPENEHSTYLKTCFIFGQRPFCDYLNSIGITEFYSA